jgi:hypothetical protein
MPRRLVWQRIGGKRGRRGREHSCLFLEVGDRACPGSAWPAKTPDVDRVIVPAAVGL